MHYTVKVVAHLNTAASSFVNTSKKLNKIKKIVHDKDYIIREDRKGTNHHRLVLCKVTQYTFINFNVDNYSTY